MRYQRTAGGFLRWFYHTISGGNLQTEGACRSAEICKFHGFFSGFLRFSHVSTGSHGFAGLTAQKYHNRADTSILMRKTQKMCRRRNFQIAVPSADRALRGKIRPESMQKLSGLTVITAKQLLSWSLWFHLSTYMRVSLS